MEEGRNASTSLGAPSCSIPAPSFYGCHLVVEEEEEEDEEVLGDAFVFVSTPNLCCGLCRRGKTLKIPPILFHLPKFFLVLLQKNRAFSLFSFSPSLFN